MYVCVRVIYGFRPSCVNFEVPLSIIVGSYYDKSSKEWRCVSAGVAGAER